MQRFLLASMMSLVLGSVACASETDEPEEVVVEPTPAAGDPVVKPQNNPLYGSAVAPQGVPPPELKSCGDDAQ